MDNDVKTQGNNPHPHPHPCPAKPGTILRVFFPPGTVINLLNLVEVSSPAGICIIIRLPLLAGSANLPANFAGILDSIKEAGGQVEVTSE